MKLNDFKEKVQNELSVEMGVAENPSGTGQGGQYIVNNKTITCITGIKQQLQYISKTYPEQFQIIQKLFLCVKATDRDKKL